MTRYVPSCIVAARTDAIQPTDAMRVASVLRSGALHRAAPALESLVAEAADVMGTELAAITVVLHDRQEMVAAYGMKRITVAREETFCTHVVAAGQLLVISDAHRDPFFANHPAVVAEHGIRTYCGYPIRTGDGEVLGALCVMGAKPQTFDRRQLEAFTAVAQSARRVLLPSAPPVRMPLPPDAGTVQLDPLAAWIEQSLPTLDARMTRRVRSWRRRPFAAT